MNNQIKWSVDQAHTKIGFEVENVAISNVKYSFKTFDGDGWWRNDIR